METYTGAVNEAKWQEVLELLKTRFGKKIDLQGIIFLIGHRELGKAQAKFSKEEKQDLMHIGVCTLLAQAGYYQFVANDKDGWPHFEKVPGTPRLDNEQQEELLKNLIIRYFENL